MRSFHAVLLAAAHSASPVDKVVSLLKEMEVKIAADETAEQEIYDKYACWCEKTTARKANAIEEERATIGRLQDHILTKKGELASLAADIEELTTGIKDNQESQSKATSIREKENAAFQADTAELQEAIGSLDKAIRVLSGAGTGKASELVSVAATLRSVIQDAPQSAMAQQKVSVVRTFLANPAEFAQTGTKYSPQSATVQGILKDMYDTFALNLEENSATEASKQAMYEDYMHTKIKELKEKTEALSKREVAQSEAKKSLSMAEEEREDTIELLEGDTTFFEDTKKNCQRKTADWAERQRLRAEEKDGITKALEILDSDDAKALFASATTTFVQAKAVDQHGARQRVVAAIQAKALQSGSPALSAVAVELRLGGHFDRVIAQIEKLMDKLREEEQQDIVDRDECIENENKHSNEKDDLEYEVKKLGNKIEKLEDRKLDLQDRIDAIHVGITDQTTVMEDALTVRTATHDEFLQAKSDDEAAIELLSQAIKVLGKFYKNNALLQRNEPLVKPPEFDEDPDRAPEANVDKKYEGSQRQNGGIVALLQHLKEQLQNEVAAAVKAEEEDTAAYEKQRVEDRQLREDLKQQAADLGEEKANTEQTITNTEEKKTDTQTHADDVGTELDRIKESCEWIRRTFDKRREMRKAEMKGLRDAKNLLAGQDPNSAFLQKKTHH
mmetsp:Transcript_26154/g.59613  ORF Transcript_26154/g.59613 Transcript_26154/m.59613 type:complete len:675 (+) Transcript_26154:111-2135(+)